MPEYDVFLSHNNADQEAVEIIAHRLREEAKLLPFLDEWHLIPGEPWQEAIEEALGQSETVAVFVGPSGISPWHNEEMRAGLDQAVRTRDDYRVIPVLLPGASEETLTGFLARRTWVDFRAGLDDVERRLARNGVVDGDLGIDPSQQFQRPIELSRGAKGSGSTDQHRALAKLGGLLAQFGKTAVAGHDPGG